MRTVTIDRHVLASSASRFDLAWRSFGWTPDIAGSRANRLEEEVPWGNLADRAASPGWLSGQPADIVRPENLDRLQWAFLPLDGRLGLSMWGATGDRATPPGDRRVLTHTLLFDATAFRRLAGYPFGLLGTPARPGAWLRVFRDPAAFREPVVLEALRLTGGVSLTRAFETARIAEVRRLRSTLLGRGDGGAHALADRVARIHEALSWTGAGEPGGPRLALRDDLPDAPLMVRLAWLSLPLKDRARTWFSTEQARTERPRARLMVLPVAEWGRSTPSATRVLEPARGSGETAGPARARWAALVAGPESGSLPVRLLRRADARNLSLLEGDAVELGASVAVAEQLERWDPSAPSWGVARAVALAEAARSRARARGAGGLLARGGWREREDPPEAARRILEGCREVPLPEGPLVSGAVRALLRIGSDAATAAGFLRCFACLGARGVPGDLQRLGLRERSALEALLDHPEGPGALVLAVVAAERAGTALGAGEGGRRIRRALGRPVHVAAALRRGSRLPAGIYLSLAETEIDTLADAIDRVGADGQGIEPSALDTLVRRIATGEGTGDLVRIWRRTEGSERVRLEVLTHPAWRAWPPEAETAFGEARSYLRRASMDAASLVALAARWIGGGGPSGPLGGAEGLLIVDLHEGLAARGSAGDEVGEAAIGQRTGGVVSGRPAVSPTDAAWRTVQALDGPTLAIWLRRVAPELCRASLRPGVLSAVFANPVITDLAEPQALEGLLRMLWCEWTPDDGLPSLRGAVVERGAALTPLLGRLAEAPAPLPLGSLLRALGAACSGGTRGGETRAERRALFLRGGGP